MVNGVQSIYDFPQGYPSFDSIRKEAFHILREGRYLTRFGYGRPGIRIRGLSTGINTLNGQNIKNFDEGRGSPFFFPILELIQEDKMSIQEVRRGVLEYFQALAQEAIEFAYTKEADHIPHTFFLAWGIANNLFTERQLKHIRFDHGHEQGSYYGERYVEAYGGENIGETVDWVVNEITDPKKIEARIRKEKEETSSILLQQQISGKVHEYCSEGCPA